MIAILVDISIDNYSWFTPTAVAGIGSVTERQECRICCCVTTTVFMHVNLINLVTLSFCLWPGGHSHFSD
jgi:hypothetical protein